MTEEKQNIAIYKLLGYQPVKSWRYYHDKEKTCGPLGLRTKKDALEAIERAKNSWPYTQFPLEYEFSEPEEYEDWYDLPSIDLDFLRDAEKCLLTSDRLTDAYETNLCDIVWFKQDFHNIFKAINAPKFARKEALLKTLNLWE